jgi:hypothetical protein
MFRITQEEAIHNARTKLGLQESTPARAWQVRRLDRPSETYYLVQFGDSSASVAVATVDANTGEIGVYVDLPGVRPHISVDAQAAIELSGVGEAARTELVWMPCRASKSPLYPLWEVRTPGVVRYVDQQRTVLDSLDPAGLG